MNTLQEQLEWFKLNTKAIEDAGIKLGVAGQKEIRRINTEVSEIISKSKPIKIGFRP